MIATHLRDLIERIGSEHVERRLEIEDHHEAQLFGQGLLLFNIENWKPAPWLVKFALKLSGLYARARRNADYVVVRRNKLTFADLPPAFDNFTILHLTDLHADTSVGAMRHLLSIVGDLEYDICVLTGDYRGKTYGPFEKCLEIMKELRAQLSGPIYGVLGNHDSIHMTPSLEAMGIRMMFNECEPIVRQGQRIFLSGVDDPHFYRSDDIEKAASSIPSDAFSILLRTRRKFTIERRVPGSISCSVDTLTAANFAYPAGSRSSLRQCCHDHRTVCTVSVGERHPTAPHLQIACAII